MKHIVIKYINGKQKIIRQGEGEIKELVIWRKDGSVSEYRMLKEVKK